MEQPRDVLIRFHEVALKGRNRPMFINALVEGVRRATQGLGVRRVWTGRLMVRLEMEPGADWPAVRARLTTVSGIAKFALAHRTGAEYDAIAGLVREVLRGERFASFRIITNRADKRFALTSQEMNARLGEQVRVESGARVSLTRPEVEVRVEILPREAFVYVSETQGAGGLPTGTGGRVAVLMSGGIDSPVAAWRMMRRGCRAVLIHFHAFPLVEGRSREKARELAELLNAYQYDTRLYLVPFAPLQQQVLLAVPPEFRVVAYRRFMVRIAEAIARRDGARALVTGESLGQVGSQTLTNITTIDAVATMPILRPLIGMDKQEIVAQAQRIGTFETSILPDEDCCTLFTPRSPSTAVHVETAAHVERSLPIEELVAQAVAASEVHDYVMGTPARARQPA